MKKLTVSVILVSLVFCLSAKTPELNYSKLNSLASKEYLKPIRPGYEGRNPYWNGFAKRFIYAPAFDFKSIEGAEKYVYIVETGGQQLSFTAAAPNLALSPVWNRIPVGDVKLTVKGCDGRGNVIGIAGSREFYRDFPFCGPYNAPVRSYKETAVKALLYLHNLKPVLEWENSTVPDMSFWQYTYPCKTVSAIIRCELLLTKFSEKQKAQAEKIARNCGDFLMSISMDKDKPLAFFPPTYYKDLKASAEEINRGKTMSMEAAKAAMALLDLYDYTGDRRYYDHAIGIVDTYRKLQREDGSIPMKLYYETGAAVNEVNASLHPVLYVLRRLQNQYKLSDFSEMKRKAEHWMETQGYANFEMVGQFEDVPIEDVKPYENLTHWTGVPYITYVLENGNVSPEMLELAGDVIRFGEDQFTIWDTKPNADGIHYFDTPCVTEQYKYWVPVDDSAVNMATAWLHYYQETGDKLSFAKAKAIFDELTVVQHSNSGMIPTVWKPYYKEPTSKQIWPSCMMISIQALLEFSAFVGEEQ